MPRALRRRPSSKSPARGRSPSPAKSRGSRSPSRSGRVSSPRKGASSPRKRSLSRVVKSPTAQDRKLRVRRVSQEHGATLHAGTHNVHEVRQSLFDEPGTSFRGFVILGLLVVLLANLRLVWTNVFKYGILVDFRVLFVFVRNPWQWPNLSTYAFVATVNIAAALNIERGIASGILTKKTGTTLHIANILWILFFPVGVIRWYKPHPVPAIMLLLFTVVLAMKMSSFAHANHTLRRYGEEGISVVQSGLAYPDNLTFRNIYYFVVAPTLVYAMEYPRTERRRKRALIRWCIEFVTFSALIIVMCQQYVLPLLTNAIPGIREGNIFSMIERLLKLSLPNFYVWLVGFYVIFHLLLNIIAEVTRFGDRLFYRDWWNAKNLEFFWRTWNMPVHNFVKCHVYIPLVSSGYGKISANLIIFTLSAALHELIISVPFQSTKMYAFFGMMAQIPLIFLSRLLKHSDIGNALFWVSILLGQPLIVLIYFYEYTQGI